MTPRAHTQRAAIVPLEQCSRTGYASRVPLAIITGGNRGIGRAVAEQLAFRGYRVVIVARDRVSGEHVAGALAGEFVFGDLSSVRTTRDLAERLRAFQQIDVFVHNAGLWPAANERNEDGVERAFATNHLAPFLLNHLLEPTFVASRTRVVQVSAGLAAKGRPDPERSAVGADFHAMRTYATTKLYNLMTVPRFAERWADRGVTINAVHPGVIRTGLGDRKGAVGFLLRAVKRLWKSPEEGARPVVRLAVDAEVSALTGRYFDRDREIPYPDVARDDAMLGRIWEQALTLTGLR